MEHDRTTPLHFNAFVMNTNSHIHHGRIVGTPEQIADALEEWQAAGVDGINVVNWVIPGSFIEFAEKVLPVYRGAFGPQSTDVGMAAPADVTDAA